MKFLSIDIEEETRANTDYRRVIFTSQYSQVVLMNLIPGEEIGLEIHPDNDQFLRFESGEGTAIINGRKYPVYPGVAFSIPAGTEHNFINDGFEELKLYTIYSPPHHPIGLIQHEKSD